MIEDLSDVPLAASSGSFGTEAPAPCRSHSTKRLGRSGSIAYSLGVTPY